MTTVDYILIIIAVVIMMVGLYMIIRGILNRKGNSSSEAIVRDKNGIPIIPRHERKLVVEPEQEEIEQGDTVIIPDREHLQPVIHQDGEDAHQSRFEQTRDSETLEDYAKHDSNLNTPVSEQHYAEEGSDSSLDQSHLQQTAPQQSANAPTATAAELAALQGDDNEDDVFSNLASATEKLMPVIETAREPDFTDNSPMLDHHLLAEADQDQNSPLNHAQENINITIMPKNNDELIEGKTILSLVSQYGLKYGAMNMFHRYENKDGSGILWFSMMGINHDGITPFDLNVLPNSKFSGLVLFLSLPHPKATQGFDTMMSVVNLISNDLNAVILDENNEVLTRERRQQLRNQVQEYNAKFNQ